ncbi:MAG TPA: DUF86 domain-containing protein [Sedimentisphaerales bacterium]|nr:DUF86 domain-containing protein [Sedimentisphaerales bacterium]HRV49829.1 DUF86 domain-containing protein [Sedimentisphaerales bacterium]
MGHARSGPQGPPVRLVAGRTFHEYAQDEVLQAAVERKLEIIGEAARGVSDDFRRDHPEVPWRGIIGQRHFLAHEYGEVRQEKLWRVATTRISELIEQLEKLIPPTP